MQRLDTVILCDRQWIEYGAAILGSIHEHMCHHQVYEPGVYAGSSQFAVLGCMHVAAGTGEGRHGKRLPST